MPRVGSPSMATIRSPGSRPALAAGVPSMGAMILGTPCTSEISMPRPPNLPVILACDSLNSCLVHVVGMRIEAAEHALERILGQIVGAELAHVIALDELDDAVEQREVGLRRPALGADRAGHRAEGKRGANDADEEQTRVFHGIDLKPFNDRAPRPGPRPATAHMAYRRGAGKPKAEFRSGRRPGNAQRRAIRSAGRRWKVKTTAEPGRAQRINRDAGSGRRSPCERYFWRCWPPV